MKNLLPFCFLFFLVSGCELNEEILDEVEGSTTIGEPDFEANLAAPAYAHLGWGFNWAGEGIRSLNNMVSDEYAIPRRGRDWDNGGLPKQAHQHTWTPEHEHIKRAWKWLDQGASKANTGLHYLSPRTQTDDRDQFIAELRFLRAYYRYWQLDMYRQIPMRHENDLQYLIPPPVLTGEDAFNSLINELIDIIPFLQDRYTTPYGRITKAAAQMLLAKLYLNAGVYLDTPMWEECLDVCDEVISSGHYSIHPDYFSIFGTNNFDNTEAIFIFRRDRNSELSMFIQEWVASMYWSFIFPQTWCWGGPAVVSDFLYTWDEDQDPSNGILTTDKRFYDDRTINQTGTNLGFILGPQFRVDGSPMRDDQLSTDTAFVQLEYTIDFDIDNALQHEGVRVIKYEPDMQSFWPGFYDVNDFMIFRYADLSLMAAEAKFRLGKTGEALADINTLREIRGAKPLTSLAEQDILNERGFELYWEGWRRQDLIRFDQFTRPWANKPQSEKYREVFPIPSTALSSNKNLEQNPGY